MLRIYISTHCRGCKRAVALAERLRACRKGLPLEIINVDQQGSSVPRHIIGTPIYTWNHRILFMGNPSEEKLLASIDTVYRCQSS